MTQVLAISLFLFETRPNQADTRFCSDEPHFESEQNKLTALSVL